MLGRTKGGIASYRLEGRSMPMLPMLGVFSDEGYLKDTDDLQNPHWSRKDVEEDVPEVIQSSNDGRGGLSSTSSFRDGHGFKRESFVHRVTKVSVLILFILGRAFDTCGSSVSVQAMYINLSSRHFRRCVI